MPHIISSGDVAMNKNIEKPLKFLGRIMAKFKDICYMPETRGKLRTSAVITYAKSAMGLKWGRGFKN